MKQERIKDTETMFPIEEDVRWLKSLKPQWKPSAELMNNLSRAANGSSYNTYLLLQLYTQLKSL